MKKKILIVDDQAINRRILTKILQEYTIVEASDGVEALNYLRASSTSISAVILDLYMPNLDGFGVLEIISRDPDLSTIPVIVASQGDKSDVEDRALSLGARDFISKPYNPDILRRRLANLIELYESNLTIINLERDTLTGLYNKDGFYNRVTRLLAQNPDRPFLITSCDIEHFKLVNDSFGMNAGDELLCFIAHNMREDVHDAGGICARISADHFLIIIPADDNAPTPEMIVERSQASLNRYPLNMTLLLKFGMYYIDDRTLPIAIMCDRATLAANTIKGQYDKPFAVYDDALRQKMLQEQLITNAMEESLRDEQFQVYFQPKYDLVTECIAGAEALVRWIHPTLGFMNPNDFIPLFERNGFITKMDMFVWEKTCETIADWITRGNKYVPVSVNVSRKDIYQIDLLTVLPEMVKRHGLRPEHLHLEITESAYTTDANQIIEVVRRLKGLGFIIEMDDFGSGYSSLNMLAELPIDILKLDMRFIQKETARNSSRNILSFIISLAKWMNLLVVAEGVETEQQIALLRNMDCNYVQGYYYARPMPGDAFTPLLLESTLAVEIPVTLPTPMLAPEVDAKIKGHTMLIVDDEPINRTLLASFFSDLFTIVEADDGKKAYQYIQEHFDTLDIILLDLMMPNMNGFELLAKLQVNALYGTIPVVVTSQAGQSSEAEAFNLGACDFLSKPYDRDIAQHRIKNVTARTEVQVLKREKKMLTKMNRLAEEARLDSFTGVFNKQEMQTQVQNYFVKESQNIQGIFIMLDMDDFKRVNDTYGHDIGDEAIRTLSGILMQYFRKGDIVSRMGGDEFAVFLKADLDDIQLAQRMADLRNQLHFQVQDLSISCSIGVCTAPNHAQDFQELYHNADMALLTAKRLGKNQYSIWAKGTELPETLLHRNMDWLLDESSDAIMICDTKSYELYYLNEAARLISGKDKSDCVGKPCYQAIWDRDEPCSHCVDIGSMSRDYCQHIVTPEDSEQTLLIKGKLIDWGDRLARIQYIQDYTWQKE